VHAFATDPRRGIFILAFLVLVIGGSLTLFAVRAPKVGRGGQFDAVSRESMLLANNVLLIVAAGSVLLGTLYPLFLDALALGKISVGPPYFASVFVPVMTPLVFLMGVGPIARWKKAELPELGRRLRWAFAVALVTALLLPLIGGEFRPMVSFGLLLSLWIVTSTVVNVRERVRGVRAGFFGQLARQPRGYWGMIVAHLGIAVFIVGVTLVKGYEAERDVRMGVGDTLTLGAYTFRFDGVTTTAGPNYTAARGIIDVSRNGVHDSTLYPEKRNYNAGGMPMTEAAIESGPFGDRYVSLGEPIAGGAWSVRIYSKPFVTWIWAGCMLMALGGFLALSDRRYRAFARRDALVLERTAARPA
jgi:cytochrome c-type biogenesis protein CcmF